MTEHSKIPVPPAGQATDSEGNSLIERAFRTFDLGRLSPPPVPVDLAPREPKPAMRHRPAPPEAAPAGEPVAPMPVPMPVPAPEPMAAPAPEEPVVAAPAPRVPVAYEPEPVAAEPPVDAQPAAPRVEPVRFSGARHPVDRELLREQGLIVPEGAVTTTLEEFRIVKRQLLNNAAGLRAQGGGAAAQRILVCSPHPGEGKTWCAVNLALSIASERETEVLLVDADFAKPSVLGTLGLPGGKGLMDALIDPRADVASYVLGTDVPGLWVLPSGNTSTADSEYVNSSRTAAVLARLTEGAPNRIVIFDSPPVLAASPAAELARHVGQAVLVARADSTGQGALEDAISLLSACPNIQLLLNAATFSPSGRRFGSYYGYGG